jgi:hypothetical protein
MLTLARTLGPSRAHMAAQKGVVPSCGKFEPGFWVCGWQWDISQRPGGGVEFVEFDWIGWQHK